MVFSSALHPEITRDNTNIIINNDLILVYHPLLTRLQVKYEGHSDAERIAVLEGDTAKALLEILNASRVDQHYTPKTTQGDPSVYQMVFYDGGPIAQVHNINKDDEHYYWSPWETNILDDSVSNYLETQQ